MSSDLLFELGTEELPSGSVQPLGMALAANLENIFAKEQLQHGEIIYYATPRRIAVKVISLADEQPEQHISKKGPSLKAAYDAKGEATKALIGFASSCGVGIESLVTKETEKGPWLYFEAEVQGSKTIDLIPSIIKDCLAKLPIAKYMSWGVGEFEFVRPVHWGVLMFGDNVISMDCFGIKTGNLSYGHRFHHPQSVEISSIDNYESTLEKSYVKVKFSERRQFIVDAVQKLAADRGYQAVMPESLVDEVASIVEWPVPLLVEFDAKFLDVPSEALIASMQSHQKCFALIDNTGKLQPFFITVANIESTDIKQVVAGNEKVMRARLSDAAFFYKQDMHQPLKDYRANTAKVVFQNGLGSLEDKSERMQALIREIVPMSGLDLESSVRAAFLSKCDLMTGMVGEFPELQGLMGYYYADHDGENKDVAIALNQQYMPRYAADKLPDTNLGFILSLVDRVDTLVGNFAIGQRPTGEKDPFKLRRHALAVARLLVSYDAPLSLVDILSKSLKIFGDSIKSAPDTISALHGFILERLVSYYQGHSITQDMVNAARATQDDCLFDLDKRVNALVGFVQMPEAASLAAACKRVNNILQRTHDVNLVEDIDSDLFSEPAERALFTEIINISEHISSLNSDGAYVDVLKSLATLRTPVDNFFDDVMVMVDDEAVKHNRIALLSKLQKLLQGVADISQLNSVRT